MDTIVNISDTQTPKLNEEDEKLLVRHILNAWDKGKEARADREKVWRACQLAYDCQHDDDTQTRLEWRSRGFLPWAYESVEAWGAHMAQTIIPRDEDMFTIQGRTKEDDEPNDVMTKSLRYSLEKAGFAERFPVGVLKPGGIHGQMCMKVYWRKDKAKQRSYQEVVDPETGQVSLERTMEDITTYNDIWFDPIPYQDFVFYPVYGDINKTTRIHQTYRFKDELEAQHKEGFPYVNMDKVKQLQERGDSQYTNRPSDSDYDHDEYNNQQKEQGLNIKEAWIHRVKIGDKVYHNMVATLVEDKVIIRFHPNPYPLGVSPFIYASLIPDGSDLIYGDGILAKTIYMLKAGNLTFNAILDEIKIKVYGGWKYWDDGVFNPFNFVARPGGLYEFADAESVQVNMQPLFKDMTGINMGFQELTGLLKPEFEEATMPKVVKGMVEQRDATATEINQTHQSAAGKQHVQAQRINEKVIKPFIELCYLLKSEMCKIDPQVRLDIARVALNRVGKTVLQGPDGQPIEQEYQKSDEELLQELPQFLPLPEVDIKVVGYQNQIQKEQQLMKLNQLTQTLAQSPAGVLLDWPELAEDGFRLSELDSEKYLIDKEQHQPTMQQVQQQQQAAQEAEIERENKKVELEFLKEKNRHEIEVEKLKLEAMKFGQEQVNQVMSNIREDENAEKERQAETVREYGRAANQQPKPAA